MVASDDFFSFSSWSLFREHGYFLGGTIQLKSQEKNSRNLDSWLQQHMTVTTCTRFERQTQPIFHSGSGKVRKSLVFAVAINSTWPWKQAGKTPAKTPREIWAK